MIKQNKHENIFFSSVYIVIFYFLVFSDSKFLRHKSTQSSTYYQTESLSKQMLKNLAEIQNSLDRILFLVQEQEKTSELRDALNQGLVLLMRMKKDLGEYQESEKEVNLECQKLFEAQNYKIDTEVTQIQETFQSIMRLQAETSTRNYLKQIQTIYLQNLNSFNNIRQIQSAQCQKNIVQNNNIQNLHRTSCGSLRIYDYENKKCLCPTENPYEQEDGTCVSCLPPSFWNFSLSMCLDCPKNYYYDIILEECKEKIKSNQTNQRNCGQAYYDVKFQKCVCENEGYFDQISGKCLQCKKNQILNQNNLKCQQCPPQAPIIMDGKCFKCPQNSILDLKTHKCFDCPDTFFYDSESSLCVCPSVRPYMYEGRCHSCKIDQIMNNQCKECPEGQLFNRQKRICLCPSTQPFFTGRECTSCDEDKFWNPGAKQCQSCPKGQIYNHQLQFCEKSDNY